MFVIINPFQPSLLYSGQTGTYPIEVSYNILVSMKGVSLPYKYQRGANTLALFNTRVILMYGQRQGILTEWEGSVQLTSSLR